MSDDEPTDFDVIKNKYMAAAKELIAEGYDPKAVFSGLYWAGVAGSLDHSMEVHAAYSLSVREYSESNWNYLENKLIEDINGEAA